MCSAILVLSCMVSCEHIICAAKAACWVRIQLKGQRKAIRNYETLQTTFLSLEININANTRHATTLTTIIGYNKLEND